MYNFPKLSEDGDLNPWNFPTLPQVGQGTKDVLTLPKFNPTVLRFNLQTGQFESVPVYGAGANNAPSDLLGIGKAVTDLETYVKEGSLTVILVIIGLLLIVLPIYMLLKP